MRRTVATVGMLSASLSLVAARSATAQTAQPVVWTNVANAVTTGTNGNGLQKSGGCDGCVDSGGNSQQTLTAGDGYVEFTATETTTLRFIGLSTVASHDYALIHWSIKLGTTNIAEVREDNVYRTETTYTTGDVFRVAVVSGVVKYSKNSTVFWTSASAPSYPLYADASLLSSSASFSNAMFGSGAGVGCNTGPAPTCYNAITDTTARTRPDPPVPGPAGWTYTDPTFGSAIVRVTDGNTRPGSPNRSYHVQSNAHLAAWNTTGTRFYVTSNDGTVIPFSFNPATMTAARIPGSGDGGLILPFYTEAQFSFTNANLIYGGGGANARTILQYDFSTGTTSTLVDLDTIVAGLSGTYLGAFESSASPEDFMVTFGGASQDQHFYALWFPIGNLNARKLLNTVSSTINGVTTATTLNFHLHSASIDKTGQYVFLYPTAVDLQPPRSASQVYIWNTTTDAITAITSAMHPGGHDSSGYGVWVNQDCCTSTTWDAAQWQFRSLSAPQTTKDLINPVLTPQEVYLADHSNWNNAQPSQLVPFISSLYRYGNNTAPWRAWDDEIVAVQSDVPAGQRATVWRFAHHQSDVGSDSDPAVLEFWYTPMAIVSPNGQWVLFTSNWRKQLGLDSHVPNTHRQDVFIVKLVPGS